MQKGWNERPLEEFYSTMRSLKAMQESDICIIMLDGEKGIETQTYSFKLMSSTHNFKLFIGFGI